MEFAIPWHKLAVEDLEKGLLSYEAIGKKYGRSPSAIKKLKFRLGIKALPTKRRGPRSLASDQINLSTLHGIVANRLGRTAALIGENYACGLIGVSRPKLAKMIARQHDFTLLELLKISELLKIEIHQLLSPISETGFDGPAITAAVHAGSD